MKKNILNDIHMKERNILLLPTHNKTRDPQDYTSKYAKMNKLS